MAEHSAHIKVHGGGSRPNVDDWVAVGRATGAVPRTFEHAHPALAPLAPSWVAIMEPWPGSPGDELGGAEQLELLRAAGTPEDVPVFDGVAALDADRAFVIEQLVHHGRWENLCEMTGFDGRHGDSDFTTVLFGELGDALLAANVGVHVQDGIVSMLTPLDQPESMMVAAVDLHGDPFVVRITLGGTCVVAGHLKLRLLGEILIDQFNRLNGTGPYAEGDGP